MASRGLPIREFSTTQRHHLHLHYLQQWRNLDDENKLEKDKILNKLLSLINAISSGLKNTG